MNPLLKLRLSGFVLAAAMPILGGCGSVSGLAAADGSAPEALPPYSRAVVLDFTDATSKGDAGKVQIAGRNFADRVAAELRSRQLFATVARERSGTDELVVSGRITRYQEGNAVARLMIGLGAGSSYLDAVIEVSDGESGHTLGRIHVDRNSWALGGGLAAGQTVEAYMDGAAEKIADEIALRQASSGPVARQ